MRKLTILALVAVLALAACASPQSPPATSTSQGLKSLSSTTVEPGGSPGQGEGGAGEPEGQELPQPGLSWDTSAQSPVIVATNCCGFVPQLVQINYIPEALIFGDGRIIWTQTGDRGARSVFEGQLGMEEMAALLQQAVEQGFFEWQELYTEPNSPTDLPSQCLSIQLEDRSRRVCEYYKGAPQAFHDLYDRIAGGAGAAGSEFKPETGFLISYPIDPVNEEVPAWDAGSLGVSLEEAGQGVWVEGPALDLAWSQVNTQPYGALVVEDGKYYQISLQIPGISQEAPPARE